MAEDKKPAGYPAAEYATLGKTDAATAFGARLALAEAALKIKSLRTTGVADTEYLKLVKTEIRKAAEKNSYLMAAGTGDLVAEYFISVIDRQKNPTQAVKNFIDGAAIDKNTLDKVQRGKFDEGDLKSAGSSFLASAKKHLGIKTLTEDFRDTLADPKSAAWLSRITIIPQAMEPDVAKRLQDMETTFRRLDNLDAVAARFGLGSPAVNQWIAKTEPEDERKIAAALKALASYSPELQEKILRTIVEMRADKKGPDGKEVSLDTLLNFEEGKPPTPKKPPPEEMKEMGAVPPQVQEASLADLGGLLKPFPNAEVQRGALHVKGGLA